MHARSNYRRTFLQTEERGVEVVFVVQGENSNLRLLVRRPLTRGGRGAAQAAALKTYPRLVKLPKYSFSDQRKQFKSDKKSPVTNPC